MPIEIYSGVVSHDPLIVEELIDIAHTENTNGVPLTIEDMMLIARNERNLSFSDGWALQVVAEYMSCARKKSDGEILLNLPEGTEKDRYRVNPDHSLEPTTCTGYLTGKPPCKCVKSKDVRCPILWGENPLRVKTNEEGRKMVNNRPYDAVNLVFADGPGVETLEYALKNPSHAFIIADPLVEAYVRIMNKIKDGYVDIRRLLVEIYRDTHYAPYWNINTQNSDHVQDLFQRGANLNNIFPTHSGYSTFKRFAPLSFFDNIFVSYPLPAIRSGDIEIIGKLLSSGGNFIYRSTTDDTKDVCNLLARTGLFESIEEISNYDLPQTLYGMHFGHKRLQTFALKAVKR